MLFKVATNCAPMHLRRRRLESALISGPAGREEIRMKAWGPTGAPWPIRSVSILQM
jgi:hypothetical protein